MKETFWIIPNKLAGRPGPELCPWSLNEFKQSQIDVFINLSLDEDNQLEFEQFGIENIWIPLLDDYPANLETEKACRKIIPKSYDLLSELITKNKRVVVHCSWGRDRTGFLLAYYIMKTENISPIEAINRIRIVQPKAITAKGWEEMAIRIMSNGKYH